MKNEWQCRIAPSLGGGFDGTPSSSWGTEDYKDETKPTVFFGLYGFPDFYALWRHKGKRAILWAGSDIRHFEKGYWLDDKGKISLGRNPMAVWINENCDNYVENAVEHNALKEIGIKSKIIPSFLGDVKKFEPSYKWNERPKLYTSVSGDDFKLYGWDKVEKLAEENPEIDFYLYGNTKEWKTKNPNVIVRGRVPKEVMNEEIKEMQGALRMTEFDGMSEILVKSVLMEQWSISLIEYPYILKPEQIKYLLIAKESNYKARDYYLKHLNNYPWNICKK